MKSYLVKTFLIIAAAALTAVLYMGWASEADIASSEQMWDSINEHNAYEEINLESDLPWKEWIKSFQGVVKEPVTLIVNDNTGRKEIIQDGSTVNINPDEDIIVIYYPEDSMLPVLDGPPQAENSVWAKEERDYNYRAFSLDAQRMRMVTKFSAASTVVGKEEYWITWFKVVVE